MEKGTETQREHTGAREEEEKVTALLRLVTHFSLPFRQNSMPWSCLNGRQTGNVVFLRA